MKGILKFDLPEDDCQFKIASTAMSWALALWDLDNYLRAQIKYSGKEDLQPIRDKLHEFLADYNLNLDMIE